MIKKLLLALVLLTNPAVFADQLGPKDTVRFYIDKLIQTPKSQLDSDKVKDILRPLLDTEEMTKRSLGFNWKKATEEQQKEIVELFGELLVSTYASKLQDVHKYKIDISREIIKGPRATVYSTVSDSSESYSFKYKLHNSDPTKWLVYDIIVENVGLIKNYRHEFASLIRRHGIDGLIKKLRDKVN